MTASTWHVRSIMQRLKYGMASALIINHPNSEQIFTDMSNVKKKKENKPVEHSIAFNRELKKYNTIGQMLVMADLMSVGHEAVDAYIIAYPENRQYPENQDRAIMEHILASAKFQKLLEVRKSRIKDGAAVPVSLEETELIDTDEVAKEILRSAKSAPIGSKERADLFLRYDDIMQRNKVDVEDTELMKDIQFALPLKCYQCPLFIELNKVREECEQSQVPPIEMDAIIRKSLEKSGKTVAEIYRAIHGVSIDEKNR